MLHQTVIILSDIANFNIYEVGTPVYATVCRRVVVVIQTDSTLIFISRLVESVGTSVRT